ncbi:histidine kinase [Chitinophagaceae bacterium MMS25-I14]
MKNYLQILSLIFSFLLFFLSSEGAATFPVLNFTTADGLPSNIVYSVYKAHDGMLWFATDKGVTRYNGIRFENFTTSDGLPTNEIFHFREDRQNRLWMATYSGDLCFYKSGVFHTVANTPYLKIPKKASYINYMETEADGSITFMFRDATYFVNVSDTTTRIYTIIPQKNTGVVQITKHVQKHSFGFTCRDEYIETDTSGKILSEYPLAEKIIATCNYKGQTYLLTPGGITNTQHKLLASFPKSVSPNCFSFLDKEKCGKQLLLTIDGLFVDGVPFFKGKKTTAIAEDVAGNYWVTTLGNGVYCLSLAQSGIRTVPGAYTGTVKYAAQAGGKIIFANASGDVYALQNGKADRIFDIKQYREKHTPAGTFLSRFHLDSMLYTDYATVLRRIESTAPVFFIDSNMTYYHFSCNESFCIPSVNKDERPPAQRIHVATVGTIKGLIADRTYLYAVNTNELLQFNKAHIADTRGYPFSAICDTSANTKRIFGWAKDQEGNLWFSTINHLYKLKDNKLIAPAQYADLALKKFVFIKDLMIGCTHSNQLLVCHTGAGASAIDAIPDQGCIWEDFYPLDSCHLLINTNNYYRLLTINSNGQRPRFDLRIIESPFIPARAEYVCSDTANCYFFKGGTITCLPVSALSDTTTTPQISFSLLKTNRQIYTIAGSSANITYGEAGDIRISFASLSFGGKEIHCEYSVSQADTGSWHEVKDDLLNLYLPSYGNYKIKLRARTLSSSYTPETVLNLSIAKPWWASWWFRTIASAAIFTLLGLAIYLAVRRTIKKKQKEHEAAVRYQQAEFKTLNALMNPHFIFNSLNNIQNLLDDTSRDKAGSYLMTFAKLVRQNMHNISKDLVSLEKELELTEHYLELEKLRFKDYVNYELHIEDDVETDAIEIPPLLIQPLAENAVRHGLLPKESAAGLIKIHVYEQGDSVYVTVTDNGGGYITHPKNAMHESYGLDNLRKRIAHFSEIHQRAILFDIRTLTDDNGHSYGTVATLRINTPHR